MYPAVSESERDTSRVKLSVTLEKGRVGKEVVVNGNKEFLIFNIFVQTAYTKPSWKGFDKCYTNVLVKLD